MEVEEGVLLFKLTMIIELFVEKHRSVAHIFQYLASNTF